MKKKFLMVLLTVMAAFAVFTINASAATSGNCGLSGSSSVKWSFDATSNTLTISGTGEMGDFTGSSTQPWAEHRTSIKTIVVNSGVTSIGEYAFASFEAVTSVSLPDTLTRIGIDAFAWSNLTSINIPANVTWIPWNAFYQCDSLKTVTIPGTIESPEVIRNAFSGCYALTSITVSGTSSLYGADNGALYSKSDGKLDSLVFLPAGKTGTYSIPEGITSIKSDAISVSHLTQLNLPASCTALEANWIKRSQYMEIFTVAEGNAVYSAVDGVLFNKDMTELVRFPAKKSTTYRIPNGVTSIADTAFGYCNDLTEVTIPNSVTSIGNSAFISCSKLKTVNYLGSKEDWNAITIGSDNTPLTSATINYNYNWLFFTAAWNKAHYNPGDTATATIHLSGDGAYAGYQFTIDSIAGMTLTDIVPIAHEGVVGETDFNIDTGIFAFSLTGEENLSLDDTGYDIATLTYTVNETADGDRALTFSNEQAYLADGTQVERIDAISAPLTLHDIQVTLSNDAGGHAAIQSSKTYYAKYNASGLYTNWERTQAVTAGDFRCNVADGFVLASPMWSEDGTETTLADFAALLDQPYTESKAYTLRVAETAVLTIDTSIVTVVSGTVEKDGKHYTIKNTDLVLAPVVRSGCILLGVSASIGDQPVTVTRGEDGNYTIAGSALTGDITLSYDEISGTIEFVGLDAYVDDSNTASKILQVRMSEKLADSHLTLGEQPLFWSEKYKAYVELVPDATDEAGIRAAIARAAGEGTAIGYTGDVTGDGTVNVLDALAINAKLFEIEWKLGFTSKNLLEMDVIGETAVVDVADIQRVLAIAVGKVTV